MTAAVKTQGLNVEVDISSTATEVKEVFDIGDYGQEVSEIQVTHLKSTAEEYIGGLANGDQFQLQMNYVANDAGQEHIRDNVGATLDFTFTYSDGAIDAFSAVVLSWRSAGLQPNQRRQQIAGLRITGDITTTDAT